MPGALDCGGSADVLFTSPGSKRGGALSIYGPNLCLYSADEIKALTISAFWKLPLN